MNVAKIFLRLASAEARKPTEATPPKSVARMSISAAYLRCTDFKDRAYFCPFFYALDIHFSSFSISLHSVWVGGDALAVVKSNTKQLELLERLMRAEVEREGVLSILMVGNVGVNRVRAA